MKIKILFLITAVMFYSCSSGTAKKNNATDREESSKASFKTYNNDRFQYSVDYPDFLIPQGESDSEDGQKFVDASGVEFMMVYRDFKMDMETFDIPSIGRAFEMDIEGKEIVTKSLGDDSYTIESIEGNIVTYHHTIFVNNEYYNIIFSYNKDDKNDFESVIKHVVASFKVQ